MNSKVTFNIRREENGFWGLNGETDLGSLSVDVSESFTPTSKQLSIPVLRENSFAFYRTILSCVD
jgi:hypothetical protein